MGKIHITKKDLKEFHSTANGRSKYIWMYVGMIIDIIASLGISFLIMHAKDVPSPLYFYCMLFILLVIVVLGGELIGVYFGAVEQFFYDKMQKKVLKIHE